MPTNIKFSRSHMVMIDNYFYMFDERNNVLFKKVDDGTVAFTYPLSIPLGAQILAASYDGIYFWTLQVGPTSIDLLFKRWYISDYFCKFKDSFILYGSSEQPFNSSAFFIEYYVAYLSEPAIKGASSLVLSGDISNILPGTVLNFVDTYEENDVNSCESLNLVVVDKTEDGLVNLNFFIDDDYADGTKVCFSKNIWLFNKIYYDSSDHSTSSAVLYKVPINNKTLSVALIDSDLKDVNACEFLNSGEDQFALYVYGTSLRFLNLNTLITDKVLTMDNISTNNVTVLPIYDIVISDDSVLRLQNSFNYYGVLYHYSSYNYQCSTMRPFIDSITLDVYPKVIPSNGISTAALTAIVKDQYSEPIEIKPVFYVDDNPTGFMTIYESYTNRYGISKSYYKAGLTPATVTVIALATQYD